MAEMYSSHALVDVTRAQQLESFHTGGLVIANAAGELVGAIGDRRRLVFPRSAIKIIQALPVIESGAADHFAMSEVELAVICASHSGSSYHVELVDGLLERIGLNEAALACGCQLPIGAAASQALLRGGGAATRLHNNCSGKHAGMLATAQHLGAAVAEYHDAFHGVQQRIRSVIESVVEHPLDGVLPGIDGCGVPNWPLPLENLAVAFARVVRGQGFTADRTAAFERLVKACWAHPCAMAGEGRFDTDVMTRFPGDVFVKIGAEGVYCGGIRSLGIGFALKIDDGATRAAEVAAGAVIARLLGGAAQALGEPVILHNTAGVAVGDVRPGAMLTSLLERVAV